MAAWAWTRRFALWNAGSEIEFELPSAIVAVISGIGSLVGTDRPGGGQGREGRVNKVVEPHRVDAHVGVRVRALRVRARLSQPVLARAVGISYQQLQKYEMGQNRIAASTLWDLAEVIGCDVSDFFEGLTKDRALVGLAAPEGDDLAAVLETPAGVTMVRAFPQIPQPVQREMAALAKAMAPATPGGRGRSDPRA